MNSTSNRVPLKHHFIFFKFANISLKLLFVQKMQQIDFKDRKLFYEKIIDCTRYNSIKYGVDNLFRG